jgi:hypothetical protein
MLSIPALHIPLPTKIAQRNIHSESNPHSTIRINPGLGLLVCVAPFPLVEVKARTVVGLFVAYSESEACYY